MSAPIQPDRGISTERTLLQAQKDATGKTVGYTLYLRVTHAEGRDRVMRLSTKDTDLERIFKTAMTLAKLAHELSFEEFGSRLTEGSRIVVTNLDKGYTLQSAFGLRIQERDSALWYEATVQRNASYLGGTTGFELADSRKGRRWYNNIDRVLGEEGFKESLIGTMPAALTNKIGFLRNAVESQSSMIPKMVTFWSEALDDADPSKRITEQEMQARFNSWFAQTTQGPASLQGKIGEKERLLTYLGESTPSGTTRGTVQEIERVQKDLISLQEQKYGVDLASVAGRLRDSNVKDRFDKASTRIRELTALEETAKQGIVNSKKAIADLRYRRSSQGLSDREKELSRYQALQEYAAVARTEVVRRVKIAAELYSEVLYTRDISSQKELNKLLDLALTAIDHIEAMPTNNPTRSQIDDGYARITDAWHREAINQSGWQPKLERVIREARDRGTLEHHPDPERSSLIDAMKEIRSEVLIGGEYRYQSTPGYSSLPAPSNQPPTLIRIDDDDSSDEESGYDL